MAEHRRTAHDDLKKWLAGIVEGNNSVRGKTDTSMIAPD